MITSFAYKCSNNFSDDYNHSYSSHKNTEVPVMDSPQRQTPHFLIITHPIQSHVNPGLQLAKHLLSISDDVLVTFSTSESGHRHMFPDHGKLNNVAENDDINFMPFPDGDWAPADIDFKSYLPAIGFSNIISNLASQGRPVTCVIPTLLLTWAADVARFHGITCTQYWIQPATTFATYYHYFHGYKNLISTNMNDPTFNVKLPNMPSMQIRDLPSFLTQDMSNGPYAQLLTKFRENFDRIDLDVNCNKSKPKILVNSFDELEPEAFVSVDSVDLIGIGPILPCLEKDRKPKFNFFKEDEKGYMDWLNNKPEKSVVYVSFGSLSTLSKEQLEEIEKGLKLSKMAYLWVVRKDSRHEGFEIEGGEDGMVVEWCSQVGVLSHPSVGCFVTHCGWNSTYESLVCGVPTVGVPQWSDQQTNAMLADKSWGCGVRADVGEDGELRSEELMRCLELVMADGEKRDQVWRNVEVWKERTRQATCEGGSAYQNLKTFMHEIYDGM